MILQSKRVWVASLFIEAQIEIEEGKIKGIYPYNEKTVDVDYGDERIVPGFIDIHTHGAYGFDTNDVDPDGLRDWLRRIGEEGVTSLLPTTITQSEEVLSAALANIRSVVESGYDGATVLGVHFEGPYLDMKYKGAQPEEHIAHASIEQFERFQAASGNLIKLITLAPEHDVDFALTKHCQATGVVVTAGHSSASFEQATMAVANGVTSMTHVFNGMTPFNHREPGLIGSAFRFHDVFGEVICDGVHSHPTSLNTFYTTKGKDYAIMISDSVRAKNCPRGIYVFGGNDIEIRENGSAYLLKTGSLAGSTLKMNEGLRNLVEKALVPFDAALNSCTLNPAKLLHVDHFKGKICAGYDADVVVLGDDYRVISTYARGQKQGV